MLDDFNFETTDEEKVIAPEKDYTLPAYSEMIYGHIYKSLPKSAALDTQSSVWKRSFGQYQKLVNALLREIKMNQSVLQMGLVFGNEMDQVAQRIGAYGQFDVIDLNPLQVARNNEKYGKVYPAMNIWTYDAAQFIYTEKYDAVICFMLLQELPVVTKSKVINNALAAVKEGGKVIFIDYHNPLSWHPLRYFVRMHNRLVHPFAEKLWDREIDTFAANKTDFIWRKSTYFGRMFQKVVATRKENPLKLVEKNEPVAEESFFLPDF